MANENQRDLRLVLLGSQTYEARSTASLILGDEELKPGKGIAHCKCFYNGQIGKRKVDLVETPAWFRGYKLCDTSEITKKEIKLSVSHCPPGPHAFILVVQADMPFTEECRRSIEEHMNLLGDKVWDHTIVLFSYTGWLKGKSISEHIERGGNALQWLVEKCNHRCAEFKSETHISYEESEELINTIDKMLEKNGGSHFITRDGLLEGLNCEGEAITLKATERQKRKDEQNKEKISKGKPVSKTLNIVLLGWVLSNKSIIRKAITNEKGVEKQTKECLKKKGTVRDQKITVVDTPGWWKYFPAKYTPDTVHGEICKGVKGLNPPHAFLLMIPTHTSFTEEQRKVTEDNMQLIGEHVWDYTIVVFTDAQWLGENYTIEQHIESEGEPLRWLVNKCCHRYFTFDNFTQDQKQIRDLIGLVNDTVAADSYPSFDLSKAFQTPDRSHETETQSEDGLLRELLNVLYKNWQWELTEWIDIMNRISERNVQHKSRNSLESNLSKTTQMNFSREEVKSSPGEELKEQELHQEEEEFEREGKTLPQLMENSLKTYFWKERGAFELDGTTKLKPEWKELFEREWSRREVRLTEDVKKQMKPLLFPAKQDERSYPGGLETRAAIQRVVSWDCSEWRDSGNSGESMGINEDDPVVFEEEERGTKANKGKEGLEKNLQEQGEEGSNLRTGNH